MSTCGTGCSRPRARRRHRRALNREVAASSQPEAQSLFEAQGLAPTSSSAAALGEIVVKDRQRWADVVASRGIQPE